jgi:DNA-binding MarR family transcriptional regulator
MHDLVDQLLAEWGQERPELDCQALSIVVRVQLLAKLLRQGAEQALQPLGLKLWEYDVLSALRRQGRPYSLPATELARASMLTTGAMTTRVDRLEEKGLVRRATDPDDRRGVNVSLTRAGRRLIDEAINARLQAAETQLAGLATGERRSVSDGLRKILLSRQAPVHLLQVAESR